MVPLKNGVKYISIGAKNLAGRLSEPSYLEV